MTVASGDPTLTLEYVFDVQAYKSVNPHLKTFTFLKPFLVQAQGVYQRTIS
jgi:hypothetical protein